LLHPFLQDMQKKTLKAKILFALLPDVGGTERARALGKILDVGLAIVDKRRPKPRSIKSYECNRRCQRQNLHYSR